MGMSPQPHPVARLEQKADPGKAWALGPHQVRPGQGAGWGVSLEQSGVHCGIRSLREPCPVPAPHSLPAAAGPGHSFPG